MSNNAPNLFIQKISHKGKDLDLAFMREANFVETLDMSGPRLMLSFYDPYSVLRDDLGIKERDELNVSIDDSLQLDGIDKDFVFTILTIPTTADVVKFNCFQKDIGASKIPSSESIVFTQKPVDVVLRRIFPNLRPDVGGFPVVEDYHVLPGQRPSSMVRQLAREKGALCFFQRGKIVFKTLAELFKQQAKVKYQDDNIKAKNQVGHSTAPGANSVIRDRLNRAYVGWDMEKGFVKSGSGTTGQGQIDSEDEMPPIHFAPHSNPITLGNLPFAPLPAVDFVVIGNGNIMPGTTMEIKWNETRQDAPIDEGMPPKIVVSTVAHYYSKNKYYCRVKGVCPQ